jgi:hypothetical protein
MIHYKKLNVNNFEEMRVELEIATSNKIDTNVRFWDEHIDWFKNNTPIFYNFIEDRKKIPVRLCRFYLTPCYDKLIPHVDGLTNFRSPIGLNIPISGYQNTTMDWYSCPENNFIDGKFGFNGITASRVINFNKITKIDSTVIDCPTFVRTDVVHGVINNNNTRRLVLSLRFPYSYKFGQNFEDVMDLSGLSSPDNI